MTLSAKTNKETPEVYKLRPCESSSENPSFNYEAKLSLDSEIYNDTRLTKVFEPLKAPEEYVYELVSLLRKFAEGRIFPQLNPLSGRFFEPADWAKRLLLQKTEDEKQWKNIEDIVTRLPEFAETYSGKQEVFTAFAHAFSDTSLGFKAVKMLFVRSLYKGELDETRRWMKIISESRLATKQEIALSHRLYQRTFKQEPPSQPGVWESSKCHTVDIPNNLPMLANSPLVSYDPELGRIVVWLTQIDGVVKRLEFDPAEYRLVRTQSWQSRSRGMTQRQIATSLSLIFENGRRYHSVHREDSNSYDTLLTHPQSESRLFHEHVAIFTTYQNKIRFVLGNRILDFSLQFQPIGEIPLVDFEVTRAAALEGGEKLVLQSTDYRFAFTGDTGIETVTEKRTHSFTVAHLAVSADRSTISTQVGDTYTEFTHSGTQGMKFIDDAVKKNMVSSIYAENPEAFTGTDHTDYYAEPVIRYVPIGRNASCFTTFDSEWKYFCPSLDQDSINSRLFKMVANTYFEQTSFIPGSHAVTFPVRYLKYYDAFSDISARFEVQTETYSSGSDATHVEMVKSDWGWLSAIWVNRKLVIMVPDSKI